MLPAQATPVSRVPFHVRPLCIVDGRNANVEGCTVQLIEVGRDSGSLLIMNTVELLIGDLHCSLHKDRAYDTRYIYSAI